MTTVIAIYLLVLVGLFIPRVKPAMAFGGGALVLVVTGHLGTGEFLRALTTPSLMILIILMVLAGAAQSYLPLASWLARGQSGPRRFMLKMTGMTAVASSLMNNTAVVALLMGPVRSWAISRGRSAHPLLMPLAFAATLGGMITVIGTSTNLVLNGLLEENSFRILHTLDYLPIGLAVTGAGIVYLVIMAFKVLPDRGAPEREVRREYTVETKIVLGGGYEGVSVQQAGLRQLHGLYLVEILREGHLMAPVAPGEILRAEDRLFFAGDLDQVRALTQSHTGLALPQDELTQGAHESPLIEAMIPPGSDLIGRKVRDSQFRQRFDAAIVAIHRHGEQMQGRIGDVVLQAGDLLLLVGGARFDDLSARSKHLYSLDARPAVKPIPRTKKWVALAVMATLVTLLALGHLDFLTTLLLAAASGGVLGFLQWRDVRQHIDWELMTVLVSALGFSLALMRSGAPAEGIEWLQSNLGAAGPAVWMLLIFFVTTLATNALSNVAAVSAIFPLVAAVVQQGLLGHEIAFLALAFGASNAFLTPFGYQTNLLVYGPGGYHTKDYVRLGIGLTVIYSLVVLSYLQFVLS